MHFLKCNECGHLNEVRTEYLTFCGKCDKKLENNYTNWKKRNPDGLFDEYKKLMCVSEHEVTVAVEPAKKKSPRSAKYWIGFTVTFAIFYAVGQLGGDKIASLFRKPAYEKAMLQFASEINASCPLMVDQVTRLDNVMAMPNNTFQYNYTLLSVFKDSVDIEQLRIHLEPNLINHTKTSPQMKAIRANKTTLNYHYKDGNGQFLILLTITPDKYE